MNMQCSLIQELMFYEFKLGSNAAQATKIICCVKGESAVDHNVVHMVQEILLGLQEP